MKATGEDKKWSQKVRERDKVCQVCFNSNKKLNAHHIIPKNFQEYRHSLDNGITLCVHCHNFGKFSAHKNPLWFSNWLKLNKPNLYTIATVRLAREVR